MSQPLNFDKDEPPSGARPPAGEHGAYPPPPPGYGAPPPHAAPGGPAHLSPQDERTWGIVAHLSPLALAVLSFGLLSFLGPLGVLLVQGPKSVWVRHHSVESLNFFITYTVYGLISFVFSFVLIGIPFLVATIAAAVILPVVAAVKASNGEYFRYPLTLRFVS